MHKHYRKSLSQTTKRREALLGFSPQGTKTHCSFSHQGTLQHPNYDTRWLWDPLCDNGGAK